MTDDGLQLTPLEASANVVVGHLGRAPPLPAPRGGALESLEAAVLPALQRPPCIVSFSGGRDSSVILAVATRVARREGLEVPIPVTWRFPDAPDSDESSWQELVIRHLALEDWHRHTVAHELELLGPVARQALLAHGLLYPCNQHAHAPLLELARGGSLLTGVAGDELFGEWRWSRIASVLAGRKAPRPRDVLRVGFALAPHALQLELERRRDPLPLPWLKPPARRAMQNAVCSDILKEPLRWRERIETWARRRHLAVLLKHFRRLADDADVCAVHPFVDRRFLAALAHDGGPPGFGNRTEALRSLFGGLLPEPVLSRSHKAEFANVFWGPSTRSFVEGWTGGGVPDDLVDSSDLKRGWSAERPNSHSGLLLQAAWLAETLDMSFNEVLRYSGPMRVSALGR